jgi:phosphoglycerate dehydrogenase-like enzyme
VIVEDALYAALSGGKIGGAAIDVWWQYPDAGDPNRRGSRHPFHELPNTIVTPHNSGWTGGMIRRRWDENAENIRRFISGEPLINLVTTI